MSLESLQDTLIIQLPGMRIPYYALSNGGCQSDLTSQPCPSSPSIFFAALQCRQIVREFSGAKKTITPERNALGEDIIEAYECLKNRWRNSIVAGAGAGAGAGARTRNTLAGNRDDLWARRRKNVHHSVKDRSIEHFG